MWPTDATNCMILIQGLSAVSFKSLKDIPFATASIEKLNIKLVAEC